MLENNIRSLTTISLSPTIFTTLLTKVSIPLILSNIVRLEEVKIETNNKPPTKQLVAKLMTIKRLLFSAISLYIRINREIKAGAAQLALALTRKPSIKTIKKTGKVLILHEDIQIGGFGSDIASYISENLFEYLDAPIHRVSSLDTPVPFAENLEKIYLANDRLNEAIHKIYKY